MNIFKPKYLYFEVFDKSSVP